jgi:hypothetical protein
MNKEVLEAANALIVQRLIQTYLPPDQEESVCTVEGACIARHRTWKRYGVPADATSWNYVIEHPDEGWSVTVRSVWRDGKLMEPTATHTCIERYWADDTDLIADEDAACVAFNEWAQSVSL